MDTFGFSYPGKVVEHVIAGYVHVRESLLRGPIPEALDYINCLLYGDQVGSVVQATYALALAHGIDLDGAITAKMEYNKTREFRHGNKHA